MSALSFSALTAAAAGSPLDEARDELEGLDAEASAGVDAGILTPVVLAMVARLLEEVATVSTTLSYLASQVRETAAEFHETDSAQQLTFGAGRLR